jgi:hypothetical protein
VRNRIGARVSICLLAGALTLAPQHGSAIVPALMMMIRQAARQAATSMIKDSLASSVRGMGCKGMAVTNALATLDRGGVGRSMPGGIGATRAGMGAMPGGMGAMPGGMGAMPGGMGAMPGGMGMSADMSGQLAALLPEGGRLPPGTGTAGADPQAMMARIQQAMGQPLSPAETSATLDELAELGFLPRAMQAELKECMVLVPSAGASLGMAMGMFRSMLPQLRQARETLNALSPAEQDEVAASLVGDLKGVSAEDRALMLEHLESGFFPPRVSAAVKAGLAAAR